MKYKTHDHTKDHVVIHTICSRSGVAFCVCLERSDERATKKIENKNANNISFAYANHKFELFAFIHIFFLLFVPFHHHRHRAPFVWHLFKNSLIVLLLCTQSAPLFSMLFSKKKKYFSSCLVSLKHLWIVKNVCVGRICHIVEKNVRFSCFKHQSRNFNGFFEG